jgi:hypothetical protein
MLKLFNIVMYLYIGVLSVVASFPSMPSVVFGWMRIHDLDHQAIDLADNLAQCAGCSEFSVLLSNQFMRCLKARLAIQPLELV